MSSARLDMTAVQSSPGVYGFRGTFMYNPAPASGTEVIALQDGKKKKSDLKVKKKWLWRVNCPHVNAERTIP